MIEFINVSELIGKNTELEICNNTSTSVSIIKWQCKGEFISDTNRGIILEDELHINKALSYVKCAKETKAGLVLTPEYSFPYTVLEKIIDNKDLWPDKGKLWCLGTQGDSYNKFKDRIVRWKGLRNVLVEDIAYNKLSVKNFVSSLIYLFKNEKDELIVIPQFKIGPMHDPWNQYEGGNLCEGSVIFIFDVSGNTISNNRFLSVICSDVLYVEPNEIINNIGSDNNITLFHPQLNQKPRHHSFIDFRNRFITSNNTHRRLITLNWAEGTSKCNSEYHFNIPWSAFYQKSKHNFDALEADDNFRKLRMQNHKKNLFYTYNKNKRIDIWFSSIEEHCLLFHISKDSVENVSQLATHKFEPIAKSFYAFNTKENKWVEELCACKQDLFNIIGELDNEYSYPLNVCKSDSTKCINECCVMDKCDYFFGLCFGDFEEGQLICEEDETLHRLVVVGDIEINRKRKQKAELFKALIELLKAGVFPDEFEEFKDNLRFEIVVDSFPNIYLDKYNISAIESPNTDMKALISITESRVPSDVEELEDNLRKQLHPRYRNQVLVYYPSGIRYMYFNKHFGNKKITEGSFSKNSVCITK